MLKEVADGSIEVMVGAAGTVGAARVVALTILDALLVPTPFVAVTVQS